MQYGQTVLVLRRLLARIRDVMAGGHWVVTEGRHVCEQAVLKRYRTVLADLMA